MCSAPESERSLSTARLEGSWLMRKGPPDPHSKLRGRREYAGLRCHHLTYGTCQWQDRAMVHLTLQSDPNPDPWAHCYHLLRVLPRVLLASLCSERKVPKRVCHLVSVLPARRRHSWAGLPLSPASQPPPF